MIYDLISQRENSDHVLRISSGRGRGFQRLFSELLHRKRQMSFRNVYKKRGR